MHEAQGYALAGRRDDCHRALDRAAGYLGHAVHEQGTLILGTSTVPDPAAMVLGWCLFDLGRPDDAIAVLDREIDRIPPQALRSRVRYATRSALAYAAAGEVDHACELTHQLLPAVRDVASATIRMDLKRLGRVLRRWPMKHAVREIQPDLTSVAADFTVGS